MYCKQFASIIYLVLWLVFEQANSIKDLLNHFYTLEHVYTKFSLLQVWKAFKKSLVGLEINRRYTKFSANDGDCNC